MHATLGQSRASKWHTNTNLYLVKKNSSTKKLYWNNLLMCLHYMSDLLFLHEACRKSALLKCVKYFHVLKAQSFQNKQWLRNFLLFFIFLPAVFWTPLSATFFLSARSLLIAHSNTYSSNSLFRAIRLRNGNISVWFKWYFPQISLQCVFVLLLQALGLVGCQDGTWASYSGT